MQRVKLTLKFDVFSTQCKKFLDDTREKYPLGTTFHLCLESSVRCPFTVAELKDQVRSAYGRDNQSIFFHASEANTFDSHLTSSHRIRKESEEILTKFLIDDETLTIKEVPIELINWLYDYKHLRLNLIKYIRYNIKHKE